MAQKIQKTNVCPVGEHEDATLDAEYDNKKETRKVSSMLLNQDSRLHHPRKRHKTTF